MKQESLITVIIPVFNGEKYIKRAIQSVFNQTLDDFECLIIDDGSTDNTAEIIKHCGRDIQYIYQKNSGVAVARNTGISLAKGKFIAFLDADDIWVPSKLENQLKLFKKNPDLTLVYTKFKVTHSSLNEFVSKPLVYDEKQTVIYNEFNTLFKNSGLGTPTVMIKRERCVDVGGFDERLITAEDQDFYFRACWGKSYAKIEQVLVYVERRYDSLSTQLRSYQDNLEVIELLINRHPEFKIQNKKLVKEKVLSIYESWVKDLLYKGRYKEARIIMKKNAHYGKINSYYKLYIISYIKSMLSFLTWINK